jgi:hypothetical protein
VLLVLAACARDASTPTGGADASLVVSGLEHTLIGKAGSRGTLRADSAVLGDQLATVRLVRPVLTVDTAAGRPVPLQLAADSGTLEVGTEIVRLMRPRRVSGAPVALLDAEVIGYDPAGDSIWTEPGGRVR